jgi:hypothetical protein
MRTISDDSEIADLEKQIEGLEHLLNDVVGKRAGDDNGEADGGDDADADTSADVASLSAEVAALGKSLHAAIEVATRNSIDRTIDEIQKRDGVPRLVALARSRREDPELWRRFMAKQGPAQDRLIGPPRPSPFDDLVRQIMRDRKVPKHVAMQKARAADPQAFEAYQRGE